MSKYPGVLVTGLALVSLAACNDAAIRVAATGPSDWESGLRLAQAQELRAPEVLKIKGVFVPSRRIKINSPFSGRSENLAVVKGQAVSRQTLLFRVEDDRIPGELDLLRAQLQEVEAQLEQTLAQAEVEAPTEEIPAEAVGEAPVEAPNFERPLYREPTFFQMASEIKFTSVDAGGVWPGIDPRIIDRAKDPQDAGGIWPSYGIREMVTGKEILSTWEDSLLAAYFPVPSGGEAFVPIQEPGLAAPPPPMEISVDEEESQERPEPTELKSRVSLYQARMDLIRAEIAVLENEIASRDVFSPLDGRIHDLAVSEGSEVQTGDFLVEIYQVNPIEFSFPIAKNQVNHLELGMTVKGRLSEPPGVAFEGEISFIGVELNADKETVEVRARIDNPDDALKVGMKGAAEVELGSRVGLRTPNHLP